MKDMFEYNMELYNLMLENVTNYYKNSSRMFEKFMDPYNTANINNTPSEKMEDNKEGTFPANGHDIYNYVARYGMSNLQIQTIMKLDGRLDFDRLKRAVRLSVDAEPVFRSRFIEDEKPYWKPLENMGVMNFCSLSETDNIEQAVQAFIDTPIDLDRDPMLNVRLIRSKQYDVLGLKINHTCCDGGGVKEYIQLLSDIYNNISGTDTLTPESRIGGRIDQDRMFEEFDITNPELLFKPGSDIFEPMWSFPWEQCGSNISSISVCRLPSGQLDVMRKYAKSMGATINDYILTAYYRAMLEMGQPIYGLPMEIPITIDLRRYIPEQKTQAIRNFSGSETTKLIMIMNEPFSETLKRVSSMMQEIKKGYPGLQSAIGLERIEKISFHETLAYYQAILEAKKSQLFCPLYCGDRCVPTLSNLGYISKSIIKFGRSSVIDAYILPPAVRSPGLVLLASTYNSVLTLATGYFKSTVSSENVDKLLDKVKNELTKGCGIFE